HIRLAAISGIDAKGAAIELRAIHLARCGGSVRIFAVRYDLTHPCLMAPEPLAELKDDGTLRICFLKPDTVMTRPVTWVKLLGFHVFPLRAHFCGPRLGEEALPASGSVAASEPSER